MAIDVRFVWTKMETVYGGTPPFQESTQGVQVVIFFLENKVFNTRSSRVARLTAYGESTSSCWSWPRTVKQNTKM